MVGIIQSYQTVEEMRDAQEPLAERFGIALDEVDPALHATPRQHAWRVPLRSALELMGQSGADLQGLGVATAALTFIDTWTPRDIAYATPYIETAFQAALHAAYSRNSRLRPAGVGALRALTPYLERPALQEAWTAVGRVDDREISRGAARSALVGGLEGPAVAGAVARALDDLFDADHATHLEGAARLALLVPRLERPALQDFLQRAVQGLGDPIYARHWTAIQVLTCLAPSLESQDVESLWPVAAEGTTFWGSKAEGRIFGIGEELDTMVLAALAPRLNDQAKQKALNAAIQAANDTNPNIRQFGVRALAALAPHLNGPLLEGPALVAASRAALQNWDEALLIHGRMGAVVVAAWAPHLEGTARQQMVELALKAAGEPPSQDPIVHQLSVQILAALAPSLAGQTQADAVQAVFRGAGSKHANVRDVSTRALLSIWAKMSVEQVGTSIRGLLNAPAPL